MKKKQKVLAIVGPTASGKTNLAISLAKEFLGEIISADSRQIYQEMDIATAKPSPEEQQGVVHHLFNRINPDKDYTVADFFDDSTKIIGTMSKENKLPIIVGGTGLYFRILLENFDLPRVAPNQEYRAKLDKLSSDELYKRLVRLDKVTAEKIHFNNKVKIIRALEVCESLGEPMSVAQKTKSPLYDVLWLGLNAKNRQFIYDRVNSRVDKMIDLGLIDETEKLLEKHGELAVFKSTIGYQELIPYLKGECSLDEAIEEIKQNTRRYVKRQLSWFRSNPEINWLNIDELSNEEVFDAAKKLTTNFLGFESNL